MSPISAQHLPNLSDVWEDRSAKKIQRMGSSFRCRHDSGSSEEVKENSLGLLRSLTFWAESKWPVNILTFKGIFPLAPWNAYPRLRNRKFQCPQKHAVECSLAVKCNVAVLPIVKSFLLWTECFHVGSSSQHWFTGVISICNLLTMACTWRIEVQKSCWRPHKSSEQRQALDPRFSRHAQAEDPSIMSHDVTWSCEAGINGYWPSVSGPYNSIEYLTN